MTNKTNKLFSVRNLEQIQNRIGRKYWFYKGDECFNKKIVEDGFAWCYDGGTKVEKGDAAYDQLVKLRGYASFSEYKESK